jgi:hypothetical protein
MENKYVIAIGPGMSSIPHEEMGDNLLHCFTLSDTSSLPKSFFNIHNTLKETSLRKVSLPISDYNMFDKIQLSEDVNWKVRPLSNYGLSNHSKARELRFIAKQNKKRKKKNKK